MPLRPRTMTATVPASPWQGCHLRAERAALQSTFAFMPLGFPVRRSSLHSRQLGSLRLNGPRPGWIVRPVGSVHDDATALRSANGGDRARLP